MQTAGGSDFPLISDDAEDVGVSLAEAQAGQSALTDEKLYEAIGDDMEKGPLVGSLHLEQRPTNRPGRILLDATFVFDNGEVVRLIGTVPGEGEWMGEGKVGYAGGTGKFKDRRGEVTVKVQNPKRWG